MGAGRHSSDIYRTIARMCGRGAGFAVALVLKAEGSTPCKPGARAAIDAAGSVRRGTIGGGKVEAEAQRRAVEAVRTGRPVVFDFNLEGDAVRGGRPICGGTMRVLVDPTAARHIAAYAAAAEARECRARGVLVTTVRGPDARDVALEFLVEEAITPELGFPGAEAVRAALEREETGLFVSGSAPGAERLEVFVEPLSPGPLLVIVGGGHIGQALAVQSGLVGFDVTVIDDRPEFTDPDLFPEGATVRCGRPGEEVGGLPLGADAYVVIVTRGHEQDAEALAACIRRPAAYVGMIGSRRKVALMRKHFIESGRATEAEFGRVYAPVGLDIGAVTVPEIAAGIVAQLIAVRRRGVAPRMPVE